MSKLGLEVVHIFFLSNLFLFSLGILIPGRFYINHITFNKDSFTIRIMI